MDGRLELRLLGTPAVTLNGLPVELKLKKAQAVLYYLALSRGPLLRPVLAGLLWGDMPEEAAATNLRKAVAELRAALGDCVETSREAVGLRCGDALWVDVLAFEAGAGSREPARLEEALALYRGEFLAGFYVREAPDFEQWVAGERTRLRELALAALQALARGHAAAGDVAGAIAATRRMLALEPWCEEAHRELMRLLAASGQRSAALAQYEACRRALRDELDVEPDPATRRLYDEIRRGVAPPEPAVPVAPPGEPTAAPTPAVSLPPEPTPFVGRENELALLAGQLADPGCRLLTITGPGGTGKTRLAIRAAAAQAQAWPDGVYFVDLAPLGDVHLLPVTILRALAVPPSPVIEPREQLLRFLQDKHLLLLLDNFEHLLEGAGLLPELLAAAPKLKLLATSRLRLDLREEWLAPLAGLELPPGEGALPIWATLEDYSATRLFLQCVRRLRPGYRPADADVPEVVRICRLLDGLPLGLELAAAWTRTLSLPAIAAELARGLDLLATTLRDVPPRQRSLRATFDHSWRLLSARERGILRQLAVFRGGFTREAAAAVAGATLGDLAGLADASWLGLGAGGRYEVHELIRQYCGEKLEQEHEAEAGETANQVHGRHAAYYVSLAPTYDSIWQQQTRMSFRLEQGNVQAAWEWSIARGEAAIAERLVRIVYEGGVTMGWGVHTAIRMCDIAITWLKARADLRRRPELATLLAYILTWHVLLLGLDAGLYQRADACTEEALALLPLLPQSDVDELQGRIQGTSKWTLAVSLEARGRFAEASVVWEELVSSLEEFVFSSTTDKTVVQQQTIQRQGFNAWLLGRYAEALRFMEQALVVADSLGELPRAFPLWMQGLMLYTTGDYRQAGQLAAEALRICETFEDLTNAGHALWVAGLVEIATGRYTEARAHLRRSVAIARECALREFLVFAPNALAAAELALGQPEEARRLYEESLAVFDRPGATRGLYLASTLTGLGQVALATHDIAQAQAYFRQALGPFGRAAWETAHAIAGMAEALLQEGDVERAAELLACVVELPATWHEVRQRASQLLRELEAELPPDVFAAAVGRGRSRELDEVVAELTA